MSISTIMATEPQPFHALANKWNLFYHLQTDSRWTIDSYRTIMRDIQYAESVVALNRSIPDYLLYNSMFFCMKDGVGPMWEDKKNRDGGCFSYRVANTDVANVWRKLLCMMCGGGLCTNAKYESHINGITISPKKKFSVVKVWLDVCTFQDPGIIRDVQNLPKEGCLFKKHAPEF